ncbi:unnamed protein product [marine sediment metagenome]|uniref:Uncharacterized protein n=1 Tax=marine sediment metagenome TaxID=412755 RepID=X1HHX0_9ZZZZ
MEISQRLELQQRQEKETEEILELKRIIVNMAEKQERGKKFIRMIWNKKYSVEDLKSILRAVRDQPMPSSFISPGDLKDQQLLF